MTILGQMAKNKAGSFAARVRVALGYVRPYRTRKEDDLWNQSLKHFFRYWRQWRSSISVSRCSRKENKRCCGSNREYRNWDGPALGTEAGTTKAHR